MCFPFPARCPLDRQIKNCVLNEFSVSEFCTFKAIHLSIRPSCENSRIRHNKRQLECFTFVGMYRVVSQIAPPVIRLFLRWCKELKALYNVSRTIKPVPFNLTFARGRCAKRIKTAIPEESWWVLSRDYFNGILTAGEQIARLQQQVHNKVIDCSKEKLRSITRPRLKRCRNF